MNKEVEIVMEIIRGQLLDQVERGYGVAQFTINIQDGRIVHIKCNKEVSMKIGSSIGN